LTSIHLYCQLHALSSSGEKTLCCLCCASGPVSLSAKTDRGGYCSGESIAITTEAENHSSRRVTVVQATLKQIVVYYAQGDSRHDEKVIQSIEGPGIEPGGISNWNNELLPIPPTAPCISNFRIINLSYVLITTVAIPMATDLHIQIPITIGNVPFKGGQFIIANTNTYPAAQNLYPPSPGNSVYPPVTNPYPSIRPLDGAFNYSAAYPPVNIANDNYTMGETQYAPVYGFVTNYQFAPPPSYSEAVSKVKGAED